MPHPIIAFNDIEPNKHLPDPRSIIQIALSDYRDSDLTDKELAEHICRSLSLIMTDFDLVIDTFNHFNILFKKKINSP